MSDSSFKSLDGAQARDLDAEKLGASGQEVFRQRVQVAGNDLGEIAPVLNTTPSSGEYGLCVRIVSGGGGGGLATTADQGSPNTLPNGWPVKITDGISVLGTASNPIRIDPTGTTPQPISFEKAATATVTAVAASLVSVSVISANASRKGLIIHNNSASRFLYLKLGTGGDSTDFTERVGPRGTWELQLPIYTGDVSGAWSAGSGGTAQVTELT